MCWIWPFSTCSFISIINHYLKYCSPGFFPELMRVLRFTPALNRDFLSLFQQEQTPARSEGFNRTKFVLDALACIQTWYRTLQNTKKPLPPEDRNPRQRHWWTRSDKCKKLISAHSKYWFCLKLPHDITNGDTIYLAVPIRPDWAAPLERRWKGVRGGREPRPPGDRWKARSSAVMSLFKNPEVSLNGNSSPGLSSLAAAAARLPWRAVMLWCGLDKHTIRNWSMMTERQTSANKIIFSQIGSCLFFPSDTIARRRYRQELSVPDWADQIQGCRFVSPSTAERVMTADRLK